MKPLRTDIVEIVQRELETNPEAVLEQGFVDIHALQIAVNAELQRVCNNQSSGILGRVQQWWNPSVIQPACSQDVSAALRHLVDSLEGFRKLKLLFFAGTATLLQY